MRFRSFRKTCWKIYIVSMRRFEFISNSLGKISGLKRIPIKRRLTLTRPCYKYHTKRPNKPFSERHAWRSASLLVCNNRKKPVVSVELVQLNKLLKMLLFRTDSSCLLWFLFMHDQLMQLRVCCSVPAAHIHFKLCHLAYRVSPCCFA